MSKDYLSIKWAQGSKFKTDPAVVYSEINRIRERNDGGVEAELIVKEATPKSSPIHDEFEWDDKIAAHEHRKERARSMIRSLEIVRHELPNTWGRAYEMSVLRTSEDKKPRRVYRTTEDILADPIARDELLSRAIRDAISFRKRYAALSELATVHKAFDEWLENASF